MGFGQICSCVNADRLKCPWELIIVIIAPPPLNFGGSSDGEVSLHRGFSGRALYKITLLAMADYRMDSVDPKVSPC